MNNMYKKTLTRFKILLIIIIAASCHPKKSVYRFSGHIEGLTNETIYLSNKGMGTNNATKIIVHDSTVSNNGYFTFHNKYVPTDFFSLEVPARNKAWFPFLAPLNTKEPIEIRGHVDSLFFSRLKGSDPHTQFMDFRKKVKTEFTNPYMAIVYNQDSISSYRDSLKVINGQLEEFLIKESHKDPDNYAVLYETYAKSPLLTQTGMLAVYNNLSPRLKNTEFGRMLGNTTHPYELGNRMFPVTLRDTSGRKTRLRKETSRYVLLDFWASWCGPCLSELPRLKKWYHHSDRSDFDIVGVSLDTDENKWKAAITDYSIPWRNLSDLDGDTGFLFTKFAFLGIPQKVLVAPDGEILLITSKIQEVEDYLRSKNIIRGSNGVE